LQSRKSAAACVLQRHSMTSASNGIRPPTRARGTTNGRRGIGSALIG